MNPNTPAVIPRFLPEHTVLPAKYDDQGNLVRSYPGDPQAIGWTVFIHERDAYSIPATRSTPPNARPSDFSRNGAASASA
jgi:hypothetical protein